MIHGLDTGFLVAAELPEHADHVPANDTLTRCIAAGDRFGIAPQVLSEFVHIVTDTRRLLRAFNMATAVQIAERWWSASEVVQVLPDNVATLQFLAWMTQFSFARKRVLDTMLAATYRQAGIQSLLTTNPADSAVFGVFQCITPAGTSTP